MGTFEDGATTIDRVLLGSRVDSIAETIARWASRTPCTLLAIDAPLGWPAAFGQAPRRARGQVSPPTKPENHSLAKPTSSSAGRPTSR